MPMSRHRVTACDRRDAGDIVWLLAGVYSMEALFEEPVATRLLGGLSSLGRLVVLDRRGIGLSDPPPDWQSPSRAGGPTMWKP